MFFTERLARGLCVVCFRTIMVVLVTHIVVYSGRVCVEEERGLGCLYLGGDRGPQRGARGVGPAGEHGDEEGESDELGHVVGVRGGCLCGGRVVKVRASVSGLKDDGERGEK